MEILVQFKFVWGLFFAASIIIYTIVNMFLGHSTMEFIVIWQFIVITVVLVAIQYIIFGEFMLNSLSMKYKIIIHFLLCYITLIVSAIALKWIDGSKISNLAVFTAGYIFLYSSFNLSLFVYYKTTGERLNNKLAVYKQKKNVN